MTSVRPTRFARADRDLAVRAPPPDAGVNDYGDDADDNRGNQPGNGTGTDEGSEK
jgi:hypothetical protein